MGHAIGQVLVLAVGVAFSPIPIIAMVLLLSTPHGGANGLGFTVGWFIGLAAVGTLVLLLAGSGGDLRSGHTHSIVELVLGALLVVLAIRRFRKRPKAGEDPDMPGWMKRIDAFTPIQSVGAGIALSAINPKNLVLILAAGVAIVDADLTGEQEAISMAVFVALAMTAPVVLLGIHTFMRTRSERLLGSLRGWMARNNTVVIGVIYILIAAKLIGDGISGLT